VGGIVAVGCCVWSGPSVPSGDRGAAAMLGLVRTGLVDQAGGHGGDGDGE
jgi:hypothetical protein